MARLSPRDLGQAIGFLREAEDVDGPEPFPSELLDRLRGLIGCDYLNYCELDRPGERTLLQEGCARAREVEGVEPVKEAEGAYWRLRHQHPVCQYQDCTQDFAAYKLSDFLTRTQLHELEIYHEYFRPCATEYELLVGLPAPLTHTKVFFFSRQSRDFTERERLLLDLLQPHLVALYAAARNRRVLAALEQHGDSDRLVLPGRNGAVDFAGSLARDLMRDYFEADSEEPLPDLVRDWLRSGTSLAQPETALTVTRGDRRLVVHRVGHVLVLHEVPAGLTRREGEILDLLAEGFTNAEIATTLWISAGTVRIHLQHIYEKLGVRNRTAAVARARRSGDI